MLIHFQSADLSPYIEELYFAKIWKDLFSTCVRPIQATLYFYLLTSACKLGFLQTKHDDFFEASTNYPILKLREISTSFDLCIIMCCM